DHPGNGYRGSAGDLDWAIAHHKQGIVEETGFSSIGGRGSRLQTELTYWRRRGATAFLLDAFIARGLSDPGDGDKLLGFDAIWHTDYSQLAAFVHNAT
ncbi:MAG: hypothetical protein ACRDF8_05375, partial [Chloroflexota bacterium]